MTNHIKQTIKQITQSTEEIARRTIDTSTPKRKYTDYNGMELLVSILLCFKRVNSVTSVMNLLENPTKLSTRVLTNTPKELEEYTKDLKSKPKLIEHYVQTFRKETKPLNWKVSQVYLSCKKNRIDEIEELNREVLNAKRNAKADVYFKTTNGKFLGISVKQDEKTTKSNASVEKLLGEEGVLLKEIRLVWGKEKGFLERPEKEEDKKVFRKKFNPLFYDRNNVYWSKLRLCVNKNPDISQELALMLYSHNIPYPMFEFDGQELKSLNSSYIEETRLVEYEPYYLTKKDKPRQAAKLFYRLSVGKDNYKVEIRFKGDFNVSPQFHIHNE